MAAATILDFENFTFLTVGTVKSAKLRHYAKFCRHRSNCGQNIAVFEFFKMSAAVIVDIKNFKILTVRHAKTVELGMRSFRLNRSNHGRDMLIFQFFKMAAPPCWIFKISNF